ncbi:DUF1045 domain-containing protein [Rhodobacteraceae bacterium M382]|nr:DUF1045 domain-containing protein [Rhodobacteraceae bacterium M382]
MTFTRYAIYYVPGADAPWSRFATQWLGWDMALGQPVPHPDIADLDISPLTETPRKYGLHATLKPPMRLAPNHSADALRAACETLAKSRAPVTLDGLQLTRIGRFLALGAIGDTSDLNRLAAACVTELDQYRAAPSKEEQTRRVRPNMSQAHLANLAQWGYPHVLDHFRFHITLTGKLPKPRLLQVETLLKDRLAPLLPVPYILSQIALVGEAADGRFHLIEQFKLTGQA